MQIRNRSRIPMRTIRRLLDFVLERMPYMARMARITVSNAPTRRSGSGMAYKLSPWGHSILTPSHIQLKLSNPKEWHPWSDKHCKGAPRIFFKTWEEECIALIAHELRHVIQFWDVGIIIQNWSEEQEEADAENFAVAVLKQWRKEQRKVKS